MGLQDGILATILTPMTDDVEEVHVHQSCALRAYALVFHLATESDAAMYGICEEEASLCTGQELRLRFLQCA